MRFRADHGQGRRSERREEVQAADLHGARADQQHGHPRRSAPTASSDRSPGTGWSPRAARRRRSTTAADLDAPKTTCPPATRSSSTQIVEVVRGQTNRARYSPGRVQVENKDSAHKVGIRFMLDTFIGAEDGVPFAIPGKKGLCDTMDDFDTAGKVCRTSSRPTSTTT